jgi:hypothetical protein
VASLGIATLRTQLDTSGLRTGLNTARTETDRTVNQLQSRFDGLGANLNRFGKTASVALTAPITAFGLVSLRAASQAEETESKFRTVFSNIGDAAEDGAKRLEQSFGLSRRAAQQLLGDTGDLLSGFGFSQQAALDLSQQVNELAVDLASFTNFAGGAEGASSALTGALLGNTQAVRSLGIVITQAEVDAKVLELTQQGITFETERQAKAFATLKIAQEQSKNAIGDFARTSDSFANQSRQLRAQLDNLTVTLGQGLLPVGTKVVSFLREGAERFANLNEGQRTAILVTGGVVAALGPLAIGLSTAITTVTKLKTAFTLLKTAKLAFLGPVGIIAGLVAGYVLLDRTITSLVQGPFQGLEQATETLIGTNTAYRNSLNITSEAERDTALARLRAQRQLTQGQIEQTRLRIRALSAEVDAFLSQPFLVQLFNFQGQQSGFALGQQLDTLTALETELRSLDGTISILETEPLENINTALGNSAASANDATVNLGNYNATLADTARIAQQVAVNVRTSGDVFAELAEKGILAERRAAAFGNTFSAQAESLNTRIRLVDNAIDELLTLPDTSDDQIAFLVERLRELREELVEVQAEIGRTVSLAITPLVQVAEALSIPTPQIGVQAPDDLVSLASLRRQLSDAQRQFAQAGTDSGREAAQNLIDELEAAIEEIEARFRRVDITITPTVADIVNIPIPGAFSTVPASLTIPTPQAFGEPVGASLASLERQLQEARRAFREAYTDAGRDAAQALIDELTTAIDEIQRRYRDVPLAINATVDVAEPVALELEDARARLENTLANAGVSLAQGLVSAIQSNDVSAALNSVFGTGSTLATSLTGGLTGILLGGAISLFGGLFAGLFGRDTEAERERATREASRGRNVPAISISAIVNQNNTFQGGILDPANRAALDQQTRQVVTEVLEQIGIPELIQQVRGAA